MSIVSLYNPRDKLCAALQTCGRASIKLGAVADDELCSTPIAGIQFGGARLHFQRKQTGQRMRLGAFGARVTLKTNLRMQTEERCNIGQDLGNYYPPQRTTIAGKDRVLMAALLGEQAALKRAEVDSSPLRPHQLGPVSKFSLHHAASDAAGSRMIP